MSARAIGCGSLALGAVSIPVKLFTAAKRRHGRLLGRGARGSSAAGALVTDEERDATSREAIDVVELVPAETVATNVDEQVYLGPDHGGAHAYVAFARTLAQSGRVAIAHHLAHGEAHVVVVRAEGGVLVLQPLQFVDQLRSPDARDDDTAPSSWAALAFAA